jgi:hypothetical protein
VATRIGAFKAHTSQLVVWQQPERITFTFQKSYKDKRSGQYKATQTIFPDELEAIGQMFLRAAAWARQHDCGPTLPKGVVQIDDVLTTVTKQIKDRYETSQNV